eukprot:4873878-Pyramimonas_sp.AAC.1
MRGPEPRAHFHKMPITRFPEAGNIRGGNVCVRPFPPFAIRHTTEMVEFRVHCRAFPSNIGNQTCMRAHPVRSSHGAESRDVVVSQLRESQGRVPRSVGQRAHPNA